jgi:MoxR-like ATPase
MTTSSSTNVGGAGQIQSEALNAGPAGQLAGELAARAERFRADFAALREQVGRVFVGHGHVVEGVLVAMLCGGHVLLEGVPGIGKTLLIRTLSRAMSLGFSRVQFTPDLMPADITGTTVVSEQDQGDGRRVRQFVFQRGPIFAQMVLADEINRATPKTQSALLEAMAERSVTVAGVTHAMERPFFVLATQNPVEQEGTYPLPEAQLDRFFFKLLVGVSGRRELAEVLSRTTGGDEADVRAVVDGPGLVAHQQLVRQVAIAPHVLDYAVRMTLATHPRSSMAGVDERGAGQGGGDGQAGEGLGGELATPMVNRFVRLGASPRAAQALVLGAKCRALIDGRATASMADIRQVAPAVLRHRLLLNFEAASEGVSADAVIANLVQTLPQGAEG